MKNENTENNTSGTIPTVAQLRNTGRYRVQTHHDRVVSMVAFNGKLSIKRVMLPMNRIRNNNKIVKNAGSGKAFMWHIEPRSGRTRMRITDNDTGRVHESTTNCSKKDNFCYKKANETCIEKLMDSGVNFEI